jgi:diguanylate cyclase (GGDEF)-like protein
MKDELRLRTQMIAAGVWLSAVLLVAVCIWLALTWDRPHRVALAALTISATVVTVVVAMLPHERIVAGRWREPFFLSWSLGLVAYISFAAAFDAGVRSPMVLLLFLTLVYAALSYPRWAVAVVSGVSLLAVLVLGMIGAPHGAGPTDPVYLIGLMLTLAVTGVMCMWQARIQQVARAELAWLSRSDPLTGSLNRLGFTERLTAELARASRDGSSVSLVLLDFDGFKAINDGYGHAAGDDLLRWSARAMGAVLRPADALGRLGGDEFAVVLPDTGAARAASVADRLRRALAERIGASAGVACNDADGDDPDTLHRRADERLYEAKGRRPATAVLDPAL